MHRTASLALLAMALQARGAASAEDTVVNDWARTAGDRGPSEASYFDEGLFELGFDFRGSWAEQDSPDIETSFVGLDLSLAYIVTEWFEIGVKGDYIFTNLETQVTTVDGEIEADVDGELLLGGGQIMFNLPTKTHVVPYLVAAGGYAYLESDSDNDLFFKETGAFWEAGGGFKVFAASWVAIKLQVVFQQILFDEDDEIGDINAVIGSVGLSFFF